MRGEDLRRIQGLRTALGNLEPFLEDLLKGEISYQAEILGEPAEKAAEHAYVSLWRLRRELADALELREREALNQGVRAAEDAERFRD